MVKEGDIIEDFELKDQNGGLFKLSEYRGRNILLSFHPLAWTPVCKEQMLSLEHNFERFVSLDTVPVGISVDSTFCKKAWADAIGIRRLRLLADFWQHGAIAHRLGLFRQEDGFSERANVVLDAEGRVVFVKVYPIREVPSVDEILNIIKSK